MKPSTAQRTCPHGHPLIGKNRLVFTRRGKRVVGCRACHTTKGKPPSQLPADVQAIIDRYDTEILRLTDTMDLATHAEIAMLRKRIKWIERQKDKLHAICYVED